MAQDGSPLRPSSRGIGTVTGSLVLAVAYIASGWLFRTPALSPLATILAWPPVGIALGIVLLCGLRVWPGVVLAVLLEPMLAGYSVGRSLGSSAGLMLEVLGSAWVLQRIGFRNSLERVRDVLYFAAVAVLGGALLGSALNSMYQGLAGIRPWSEVPRYCLSCYRGDALSFLLVTPLVITWGSDPRFQWMRARLREWIALLGTLLPSTYLVTGGIHRFWRPTFPIRYLLFPWLFWGALRFGPPGVALTNVVIVWMAAHGEWLRYDVPSELAGEMVTNRLLLLWAYSFLGGLMGLVLAAVARQQERARTHAELIREANLALNRSLDLRAVLDTLLEHAERLVPYDTGNVMLLEGRELVVRAGRNYQQWTAEPVIGLRFPDHVMTMWDVVRAGKSVIVPDTALEKRWIVVEATKYVRNWLAVPIKGGGEVIGLYAFDKAEPGFFTEEHLRLAESLGAQAAVAIQNARLYEEQRRTESALRSSEEKFAKAFHSHPNPMVLSRLTDGRLLDCNDSYLRFFGYSREETLAHPAWDFYVRPADRDSLARRILAEQRFRDAELQLRTKSGDVRTVLASAELLEIAGERCILGVIRDITDRRRAEQALWASEERFVKAFRSNPGLMAIITIPDLRIVDANDSFLRMIGYSREEAIGHTGEELKTLVDPDRRERLLDHLLRNGRFAGVDFAVRSRSGEIHRLLMSAEIIELEGAQHALLTALDVTDQQRLQEQFQKAFHSNPMSMSISTIADGRYVDVNEGYLRMLGYTREEVIGHSALDLGVWAEPEKRKDLLELLRNRGRAENFEINLRTKSGEVKPGLLSADMVDLGGVPHLLSAVLDMTEYRQLEEQFRQSQKMEAIGRLAGGVAHDFNNLLMVMIGRADLLMVKLKEGDPSLKSVEEIQKAAWRAASLTRQLLAFSRKQQLQPRVLNLNASVADMEKMLRRLIGEDVRLVVEAGPQLGNIKADPGGIEQVLMNLCVNARDAMPQGGQLTLATANVEFDVAFPLRHGTIGPGRYVQLTVSDEGVGMDAQVQARIFEPFFTTKEAGQGTGLGLSTVYGIVQQSGGTISVYSELGHGATFKVYFPLVEELAQTAAAGSAAPLLRGSETILVVEDEDAVRSIACEYLGVAGYTVLEARNGAEALELCRTHHGPLHLLLTDVILPGMSGNELAERLRPAHLAMKVLFLSGYTSEVVSGRKLLPDGSPLVEKPFRLTDFAARVRSVLDTHSN